jgi:spermidine/putrescine transport system substrate-binding protein
MQRSRRIIAGGSLALALTLVASACGGDGGGGSGDGGDAGVPQEEGPVTLQVMNFANYMPEDIGERFEAATGHKIELTLTSSNEDAIAKLDASAEGTYDVAFLTSPFVEALINAGRLQELDHSKIPNAENLYPEASDLAYDAGNRYSMPYAWGTTGICYRTDKVQNTDVDGWNDLLDPSEELRGKVTMIDEDRWLLLPALKSLGYSANTTDEAQLQEAADLTIQAKSGLLGYDAETFYTKLDSGEAVAVMGWDGWCNYVEDPSVVDWVLPTEGSDLWADAMVIPKGSTRVEAAHEFIDFILEVENGQWVAENILYKVPNEAAMEALDPELLETYPSLAIEPSELLQQEALRDLGEGQQVFTEAVTKVKAA